MNENPQPEEPALVMKLTLNQRQEEYLWELNPLVMSTNKLDVNNLSNDVGEWYINEELDLYHQILVPM